MYPYNETENERKKAEEETQLMRNAQRFARMLSRNGQAEEELAVYIEYAWGESSQQMEADLGTLEKYTKAASHVNWLINAWSANRWEKRKVI